MQIKNYTSSVAAETSIARIESYLAAAGASGISKLFDPKGKVTALVFHIDLDKKHLSLRVPAKVQLCFDAMWKEHCLNHRIRDGSKERIFEQAHRTAWKIVQEWVEIQVSMIRMKQAEFLEVFLPYVWDGQQTYFESVRSGGFKALPERTE